KLADRHRHVRSSTEKRKQNLHVERHSPVLQVGVCAWRRCGPVFAIRAAARESQSRHQQKLEQLMTDMCNAAAMRLGSAGASLEVESHSRRVRSTPINGPSSD